MDVTSFCNTLQYPNTTTINVRPHTLTRSLNAISNTATRRYSNWYQRSTSFNAQQSNYTLPIFTLAQPPSTTSTLRRSPPPAPPPSHVRPPLLIRPPLLASQLHLPHSNTNNNTPPTHLLAHSNQQQHHHPLVLVLPQNKRQTIGMLITKKAINIFQILFVLIIKLYLFNNQAIH